MSGIFSPLRDLIKKHADEARPLQLGVVTNTDLWTATGASFVRCTIQDADRLCIYRDGPQPDIGATLQVAKMAPGSVADWLALPLPAQVTTVPCAAGSVWVSAREVTSGAWAILRLDVLADGGLKWTKLSDHPAGSGDRRPLISWTGADLLTWGQAADLSGGTDGYRSTDGGVTWGALGLGSVSDIGPYQYYGRVDAVADGVIKTSDDLGASWRSGQRGSAPPATPLRVARAYSVGYPYNAFYDGTSGLFSPDDETTYGKTLWVLTSAGVYFTATEGGDTIGTFPPSGWLDYQDNKHDWYGPLTPAPATPACAWLNGGAGAIYRPRADNGGLTWRVDDNNFLGFPWPGSIALDPADGAALPGAADCDLGGLYSAHGGGNLAAQDWGTPGLDNFYPYIGDLDHPFALTGVGVNDAAYLRQDGYHPPVCLVVALDDDAAGTSPHTKFVISQAGRPVVPYDAGDDATWDSSSPWLDACATMRVDTGGVYVASVAGLSVMELSGAVAG